MHGRSPSKPLRLKRRPLIALSLLSAVSIAPLLTAQNTPLLSGGTVFFSNTSGGKTTYEMVARPLIGVPRGAAHLL